MSLRSLKREKEEARKSIFVGHENDVIERVHPAVAEAARLKRERDGSKKLQVAEEVQNEQDKEEPIPLKLNQAGNWEPELDRSQMTDAQRNLLDKYQIDNDVDLLLAFLRRPRDFVWLVQMQVNMLNYWLGTSRNDAIYDQFLFVYHPECPDDYLVYVQIVLLGQFSISQRIFLRQSNEPRLQAFIVTCNYALELLFKSTIDVCNAKALVDACLEFVRAQAFLDDRLVAAEAYELGPNRRELETKLTCVNEAMREPRLMLSKEDMVLYSTKVPCLPLLPPKHPDSLQEEDDDLPVDYSDQPRMAFIDMRISPTQMMPQLSQEQFLVFRRDKVTDDHFFKGKERKSEAEKLNRRLIAQGGAQAAQWDFDNNAIGYDQPDVEVDPRKELLRYKRRKVLAQKDDDDDDSSSSSEDEDEEDEEEEEEEQDAEFDEMRAIEEAVYEED